MDTTTDLLLGGRLRLRQPARGYRVAIDPLLLAAFVPAAAGQQVLELGCGTGAAILALNARVPGLQITAIEPDAALRTLAIESAALNGAPIDILDGAVGGRWPVKAGAFDHVIFNPPFYAAADYDASPKATRTQAHELRQPLATWVQAARRALIPGGCLTVIIHAQQLVALCAGLQGYGAIVIVPVQPRAGQPASRVLVRAVKGRRTLPNVRPAFILHGEAQAYTAAAEAVLRAAAPID